MKMNCHGVVDCKAIVCGAVLLDWIGYIYIHTYIHVKINPLSTILLNELSQQALQGTASVHDKNKICVSKCLKVDFHGSELKPMAV